MTMGKEGGVKHSHVREIVLTGEAALGRASLGVEHGVDGV